MQEIIRKLTKQIDIIDTKEEMMNYGIYDAMEDEIDEEERYVFPC
jgi:hypothetical protein